MWNLVFALRLCFFLGKQHVFTFYRAFFEKYLRNLGYKEDKKCEQNYAWLLAIH
jgi:hypothetical protein